METTRSLPAGGVRAARLRALLDRLDPIVEDAARSEQQIVVVADGDGLRFAAPTDAPTGIRWQPVPWFAPVVAALQDDIDHVVVTVDRTGGDGLPHRRGRD